MSDDNFETKVGGVLIFMRVLSEREIAEFIVNLMDTVESLAKKNGAFVLAFHKKK